MNVRGNAGPAIAAANWHPYAARVRLFGLW